MARVTRTAVAQLLHRHAVLDTECLDAEDARWDELCDQEPDLVALLRAGEEFSHGANWVLAHNLAALLLYQDSQQSGTVADEAIDVLLGALESRMTPPLLYTLAGAYMRRGYASAVFACLGQLQRLTNAADPWLMYMWAQYCHLVAAAAQRDAFLDAACAASLPYALQWREALKMQAHDTDTALPSAAYARWNGADPRETAQAEQARVLAAPSAYPGLQAWLGAQQPATHAALPHASAYAAPVPQPLQQIAYPGYAPVVSMPQQQQASGAAHAAIVPGHASLWLRIGHRLGYAPHEWHAFSRTLRAVAVLGGVASVLYLFVYRPLTRPRSGYAGHYNGGGFWSRMFPSLLRMSRQMSDAHYYDDAGTDDPGYAGAGMYANPEADSAASYRSAYGSSGGTTNNPRAGSGYAARRAAATRGGGMVRRVPPGSSLSASSYAARAASQGSNVVRPRVPVSRPSTSSARGPVVRGRNAARGGSAFAKFMQSSIGRQLRN